MNKIVLNTKKAAAAVGPYSQGTTFERLVFTSGQLPIDSLTGELPAGVEGQTAQSLANLEAILQAGGASLVPRLMTEEYQRYQDLEFVSYVCLEP